MIGLTDEIQRKSSKKSRRRGLFELGRSGIYVWMIGIFASIVNFFDGYASSIISLALPIDPGLQGSEIEQTIHWYFGFSPTSIQVSLIFAVGGLGVMASIIFKNLADRYGRRPLFLITSTGFVAFTVLSAFVPAGAEYFSLFLAVRFVASMFLAADLVVVIMAEEAPNRSRGKLVGLTISTNAIGLAAAAILHGANISIMGFNTWQSLLLLSGGGLLFIIPIYFFMKETMRFARLKKYQEKKREKGLEVKKVSWREPLQKKYARPFMISVISGIAGLWIMSVTVTWLPMFYLNELLIPEWELLMLPIALVGLIAFIVVLFIMDRWGRRDIVIRGALIVFIGCLLVGVPAPFCHPPAAISLLEYEVLDPAKYQIIMSLRPILIPVIVAGLCIAVIGAALLIAGIGLMPLEMVPPRILSTAAGWWVTFTRIGVIASPFITFWAALQVGRTSPSITDPGGLTFGSSYLIMGIFLVVITFTAIYLGPPRGTAKNKAIEEILSALGKPNPLKRERSRKYEYKILILCFVVYFTTTIVYILILGEPYFGFDPLLPAFQVIGIYTGIAVGLMGILIYAREKWIGVEKFSPELRSEQQSGK